MISNITLAESGTYEATVTINGCTSTPGSGTITVMSTSALATSPQTVCKYSNTDLTEFVTATQGNQLQWYGTSAIGGTAKLYRPDVNTYVANVTSYYVSQKDNITGCESPRSEIKLTVVDYHPIIYLYPDDTICKNTEATIRFEVIGKGEIFSKSYPEMLPNIKVIDSDQTISFGNYYFEIKQTFDLDEGVTTD